MPSSCLSELNDGAWLFLYRILPTSGSWDEGRRVKYYREFRGQNADELKDRAAEEQAVPLASPFGPEVVYYNDHEAATRCCTAGTGDGASAMQARRKCPVCLRPCIRRTASARQRIRRQA